MIRLEIAASVAVATLSLTGYAFDASRLHDVPHLTTIAAQTAARNG